MSISRMLTTVMAVAALAFPALGAGPARPQIASIELQPTSLTLTHGRDERQVIVWGLTADGQRFDLSDEASFEPGSASVTVAERFVKPVAVGETKVSVKAAGLAADLPVKVTGVDVQPLRFIRDIEPVLAKSGCNAGTCHGAQKGKNGFMLSLRGYDPQFDYYALVEEIQGRRVNRVLPESSLMLLKAVAGVPHEGRQVFTADSRYYQLIHQWIKEGAKRDTDAVQAARPVKIEVLPPHVDLDVPGRTQRIIVLAHYADGTSRDVTREAVLSSSKSEVAELADNQITAIRRGEAAVLVRYEGQYGVTSIGVMGDRSGFAWKPMEESNFIDKHVNAKMHVRKVLPSENCTDAEFVRRIYLDLTGVPPTAALAKAFVEDAAPSPQKRAALTDSLIGGKEYVAFWSNKWADLLQCNSEKLGEDGVWRFREWIRQSVATNKPYDRFVYELATAQGSSIDNPATGYILSLGKDVQRINDQRVVNLSAVDTGKLTEDVSQTFLGVRFNCNKCHDHPFERWTQRQYYEFGAFFARVKFKAGPRTAQEEAIVYASYDGGEIKHPKTDEVVNPRVPYGTEPTTDDALRREAFASWMASAENPLFAKSYVNRMWSYFFGVGIIDPVDDIRAGNPASNPQLLDALTSHFIATGFNAQELVRLIVSSSTYQRSFRTNEWNADDTVNFSHFYPRRLGAEQMLDAVALATGTQPKVGGLPQAMRSVFAPDGKVEGDDFLKLFGRPKRESACECERTSNVSLAHALNLINGPVLSGAVVDPNSEITKLVAAEPDNAKVVQQLYYSILNRPATEAEVAAIDLGQGPGRLEVAQDLAWALLNSPAFLFNR